MKNILNISANNNIDYIYDYEPESKSLGLI